MTRNRARAVVSTAVVTLLAWIGSQLAPPAALQAPAPWPGLAGVTIVNPGRGRLSNQTIILGGDRIAAIRESSASDPGDIRLRLFPQRYVLPGLIDLRVQQPPSFLHLQHLVGLMYLCAGVTTVRDVGNFDGKVAAVQAQIRDGTLVFPRLISCVRALESDPPACPQSRSLRTAADAEPAVAELAAAGAQCVHVRRGVSDDLQAAAAAAASRHQLPVIDDTLRRVPGREQLLLDALAGDSSASDVSQLLVRWSHADAGDMTALAMRPAAYLPMLVPWALAAALQASPESMEPFQFYLPHVFRTLIWPAQIARITPRVDESSAPSGAFPFDRIYAHMVRGAAHLHAAAQPLRVGTGSPGLYAAPGGSVRVELENLVSAGLSREEAWAAATRGAGEILGVEQLGAIEPGAPADLLVFREDPTQSTEAVLSLEAVISQGRLYPTATLIGQVLAYTRYMRGGVYATLLALQTRLMLWWNAPALVDCQLP